MPDGIVGVVQVSYVSSANDLQPVRQFILPDAPVFQVLPDQVGWNLGGNQVGHVGVESGGDVQFEFTEAETAGVLSLHAVVYGVAPQKD